MDIITELPLDIPALFAKAHHPNAGAIVLFSGEARNQNKGKDVLKLEFEAHIALATSMIEDIVADAISKWGLTYAVAQHKIGIVEISECAVCVITASSHRKEAYEANQYIMHRLKHEAPIWKKEYFADGTHVWGNNCNCASPYQHEAFVLGNATKVV